MTHPAEPVDIQQANIVVRRRAVLLAALIVIAAILLSESYLPILEQWIWSDPERIVERVRTVLMALILLTTVPLVILAVYFFILGRRIHRSKRFPLEDQRLVRDTVILHGKQAMFRGRVLQGMAVALVLLSGGLAVALWRLASMIE